MPPTPNPSARLSGNWPKTMWACDAELLVAHQPAASRFEA